VPVAGDGNSGASLANPGCQAGNCGDDGAERADASNAACVDIAGRYGAGQALDDGSRAEVSVVECQISEFVAGLYLE
jgi:hypothetical protein